MRIYKNLAIIILFIPCLLAAAASAAYGEVEAIPLLPAWQTQEVPLLPAYVPQPVPSAGEAAKAQAAEPRRTAPPGTDESEFEQYVSGKIRITKTQFEILKKSEGIVFSHGDLPVAEGRIRVPVEILKSAGGRELEDAGFLVGKREDIASAFRLLGIASPVVVSTDLKQFGYQIFKEAPGTFAPVENVPVGPDYVVGPGDEIRISVWGKVQGQWVVTVDRDGNITVPRVGALGVTGLTFEQLKELLRKELSRYYTGFEMNVSMGALRTIRVYVVGNARYPGAYTVSSLSTMINALFVSGGPDRSGSMRDIQLRRGGKTVARLDLYDFLIKGDKTDDARLMPEDVIFIPPVGPLVALAGSVNNPAIYEMKGETGFSELLEMAGGLGDIAFSKRVQVERIVDGSHRTVFETTLEGAREMKLQAGDVIKIFPVVDDRKVVRITGAVARGGEYGFRQGMTVKDLVTMAGGLKYYAYDKEAELTRVHITNEGPQTEKILINLKAALAGDPQADIPLKEFDYLFVRAVPEWKLYETVSISGEVKFPGTYTIKKGEKLSSLIERAGGFTDKAYLKGAVFTRLQVRDLQESRLREMTDRLERELLGQSAAETTETLTSEEAERNRLELAQKKAFVEKLREIRATGRITVSIREPALLKGTPYDLELFPGDSLHIPQNPQSVQVIGSVYNQTAFVYDGKLDAEDYISLAGGYTTNADEKDTYVLKVDGAAVRLSDRHWGMSWNPDTNRWEKRQGGGVEPGDTIVVPEKLERVEWLRETKDITQILYQIAVTAGVLIVAF